MIREFNGKEIVVKYVFKNGICDSCGDDISGVENYTIFDKRHTFFVESEFKEIISTRATVCVDCYEKGRCFAYPKSKAQLIKFEQAQEVIKDYLTSRAVIEFENETININNAEEFIEILKQLQIKDPYNQLEIKGKFDFSAIKKTKLTEYGVKMLNIIESKYTDPSFLVLFSVLDNQFRIQVWSYEIVDAIGCMDGATGEEDTPIFLMDLKTKEEKDIAIQFIKDNIDVLSIKIGE
ncbi:MAG: hypothetical protein ACYCTB_09815 [bacterium]